MGMLLAHLAVVDVRWITIAPHGTTPGPDADAVLSRIIGIGMEDDGMPCVPAGTHPPTLGGKQRSDYLQMLDAARASTHEQLRRWRDARETIP